MLIMIKFVIQVEESIRRGALSILGLDSILSTPECRKENWEQGIDEAIF